MKNTKKCCLFVVGLSCWLWGLTPALRAQGEGAIHGSVVAKSDGSALPNAQLRLEGPDLPQPLLATSGEDGHFGFQRLTAGRYTLVATHKDFLEQKVEFTLKPREVQNFTVELSLQPHEESVEVKAEAEPIASTYSPSSTALQKETFDEMPAPQRNNLTDAIVIAAPGMIRGHDDFVHVRGEEIALNTFIDGVSFWENPHAVFSSSLSPAEIQSVNVMTGGFPAEFGNRFGGVLDIVTKSGLSMNNSGTLTLGAGTALRNNVAIEYGGHTEKAGYFVSTSGFESARFLSPPDPRALHDTGRGAHSLLRLDFNVNSDNFLKLVLLGDGTNFEVPKTSLDDHLRPGNNAFERTREQTAIFTWSHTISNDTLLNTSFYERWSRSLLLPANDPLAAAAGLEETLNTTGVKSDVTRFFAKHTIKAGIDLVLLRPEEKLAYDERGFADFAETQGADAVHITQPISFAQKKTGGEISLYVQDAVQLARGLTADLGLRYDRFSLATSDFHFSPRVNIAYRIAKTGTVLHASYDNFFVPPPVENVFVSSAGLSSLIEEIAAPLPALRSITEHQFELGVTHPISRKFQMGLTGYYRVSDNPVHTILFPDSRIYTYANFGKGRAYGMEVKINLNQLERLGLSGYLNYALSRVYFWNPVTAGFVDELDHITESGRFLAPMDQTHTLNAGLTYRHHKSGLWAGMTFEYGSGTPTEAAPMMGMAMTEARVPEHFTQNLTIGMDVLRHGERSRLGFQFNMENLTNNVYKVAQESIFSPGQYYNPRFFSGSIKIRF